MKTASVLFGLVITAAGTAHAGGPGPEKQMPRAEIQQVARTIDAAVMRLLRAPIEVHAIERPEIAATPLADETGDVMCGNVMRKSGRRHVCRNSDGDIVSSTELDQ